MKISFINLTIIFCLFLVTANGQAQWEKIGDMYGGDIRNIAQSPNGTLYAGLQNGSLYKKENGNDYWELLVEGSYLFYGNGFPGLLTLDDSIIITSTMDRGTERSTDGGNTWQNLNLDRGTFSINNSGHIFHLSHSNSCDLSISTDNGETWQTYPLNCQAMDFGEVGFAKNDSLWIIGSRKGMLFSSDQGITWEERNNGLANEAEVYSVYVDSSDNIYIGTNLTVYYSTDYGFTWTTRDSGLPPWSGVKDFVFSQDSTLFAATRFGIYLTTNAGNSWSIYNSNIWWYLETHKMIQENGYLLLATSESLYKINSQTHTFIDKGISDINVSKFYEFKNRIYAATNRGLFYSDDTGANWRFPIEIRKIQITDITASDSILFVSGTNTLHYSEDGISNWIAKPLPSRCYSLAATNTKLFAGFYDELPPPNWRDIFYSGDLGTHWIRKLNLNLNMALVYFIIRDSHQNIYFIGYSKWDWEKYIYRSTDDGMNFTEFNQGFSSHIDFWLYNITSDQSDNLYLSTSKGLYFRGSSDPSWSFRGLQDKDVIGTAIDSSGILYLIADNKIYYSDNLGLTFTPFNEGLLSSKLSSIYYNNSSGNLFVGTNKGVYRRTRPNITSVLPEEQELPKQFQLTGYPNPFNGSTKINFSIPQRAFVKISIYNSLGEKVKELLNREIGAGNHELSFDASDLPSGIYFCKMDSKKFTTTIKLVLVK